jgi:hypothetical protein
VFVRRRSRRLSSNRSSGSPAHRAPQTGDAGLEVHAREPRRGLDRLCSPGPGPRPDPMADSPETARRRWPPCRRRPTRRRRPRRSRSAPLESRASRLRGSKTRAASRASIGRGEIAQHPQRERLVEEQLRRGFKDFGLAQQDKRPSRIATTEGFARSPDETGRSALITHVHAPMSAQESGPSRGP